TPPAISTLSLHDALPICALNVLRYFTWPGNLEDLAAAVRNLALTSLEEEIGVADAERVLPQFARRSTETDLSLDLPLREAREARSEEHTSELQSRSDLVC